MLYEAQDINNELRLKHDASGLVGGFICSLVEEASSRDTTKQR
jgi:hypothetical protein